MAEAFKILIINDDQNLLNLMSMLLKVSRYEVFQALDGIQGINEAIKLQPDLILLDILMPGMDGYDTCKKLKELPQTKDIPIIFLSSLTDPKDKIKGLQVGGVDFISNVGDPGELLARVQTHITISNLSRQLQESNRLLTKKQNYLNEDLEAAAIIQRNLLPQKNFNAENLDIAWRCVPCDQVGGDVFNILRCNHDFIFYILDVSGHGIPSAMVTVSVSQHLHQYIDIKRIPEGDCPSPAEIMSNLDKEFPIERFNKIFSIFYMVFNTKTGEIKYSNAGHPPPVLLRRNKPFELLETGGAVIGINESGKFEEKNKQLQVGDKIFLYTDGVTEYTNSKDQIFGSKRFYQLLEEHKEQSLEQILDIVYNELHIFGENTPANDDVSMMGIELKSLNESNHEYTITESTRK